MVKKLLTIAGSDSLSGGGIQADLATFNEFGYFGLSVITSIVTVTKDDFTIYPTDLKIIQAQLDSTLALADIAAIKVGLLPTVATIDLVVAYLKKVDIPIIIDPVMVFKETDSTNTDFLVQEIKNQLLPLATIVTPNLYEAQLLSGLTIESVDDMKAAAKVIGSFGAQSVVVKSGARLAGNQTVDVLFHNNHYTIFEQEKIMSTIPMNNGAGCTFSSSIAANIVTSSVTDAVADAKAFVLAGIENGVILNENFEVGNVWQAARRLHNN
ncbi:bifunctional hydroxymethylpyrimidine kinase/phosphomethylpyrimidine kinase [Leuconostoc koreense]|nr:bifunctional hydroxymethylpyrimidine kinase/phosphomethylpyrimidine kinase [Leuconostoc mesenteroides]QGM25593.1 bifunctional hydroxymethylpyrimidine kinase/phosphomethylpyrimidine kinase [Leuconostoc mesenteroides subsp. mesenteroides]